MLAIRLQRTGRTGHTQFRVIVQDSRFSPTRGRIVSYLGSYDPHTKTSTIDGAKASQFLEKGAQPSDRVARLLKKEGIKLPAWVKLDEPRERTTRHPEKRRSTRPAGTEAPAAPAVEPEVPAEAAAGEAAEPAPVDEETAAAPAEETPAAEEPAAKETPAEEAPAEAPAAEEEPAPEEPAQS